MFGNLLAKWRNKDATKPEKPGFLTAKSVPELLREELAIVFKHSTACPVSWAAHAQMTRFLRAHPDAPIYLVPVIQDRAFSQKIAAATEVRHESPQIIVLRSGQVTATASHGRVTADSLAEMLGQC